MKAKGNDNPLGIDWRLLRKFNGKRPINTPLAATKPFVWEDEPLEADKGIPRKSRAEQPVVNIEDDSNRQKEQDVREQTAEIELAADGVLNDNNSEHTQLESQQATDDAGQEADFEIVDALPVKFVENALLCVRNKPACKKYLDEAFIVAQTHNLEALKCITELLVNNKKLAEQHCMYKKLGEVLQILSEHHQGYIDHLVAMTKNENHCYPEEVSRVAQEELTKFIKLGDIYAHNAAQRNLPNILPERVSQNNLNLVNVCQALKNLQTKILSDYKRKLMPAVLKHIMSALAALNLDKGTDGNIYQTMVASLLITPIRTLLGDNKSLNVYLAVLNDVSPDASALMRGDEDTVSFNKL